MKHYLKLAIFVEVLVVLSFLCMTTYEYAMHGEFMQLKVLGGVSAIAQAAILASFLLTPVANWWFKE